MTISQQTNMAIRKVRLGIYLMPVVFFSGCQAMTSTSSYDPVIPDTFTVDGTEWTRQPWTDVQDRRLANFFRQHASLADNPGFSGDPLCYSERRGAVRYYWVRTLGDECRWAMLEFRGSKAGELVEGSGAPFQEVEPAENER